MKLHAAVIDCALNVDRMLVHDNTKEIARFVTLHTLYFVRAHSLQKDVNLMW